MVSFVPLDVTDEESVAAVLAHVDNAMQYGEDLEPTDGADGQHGEQDEKNLKSGFHDGSNSPGRPLKVNPAKRRKPVMPPIRADRIDMISRRSASHRQASLPPDNR